MQLKYLFHVEYRDGTSFQQKPEDVSKDDPKKSAFSDVKLDAVKRFSLVEQNLWHPTRLTVDLDTALFTLNGVTFQPECEKPLPVPARLELIFFRRHQHDFSSGTRRETAHRITYVLGWQTTLNGVNYQQKVGLT